MFLGDQNFDVFFLEKVILSMHDFIGTKCNIFSPSRFIG
jgi:hypothetical protein